MIDQLNQLTEDTAGLNTKLVLLVGKPRSGKSRLLRDFSDLKQMKILNLGVSLGRELLIVPNSHRPLRCPEILRELLDHHTSDGLLLMDNIEILFDRSLIISPLDLLRRYAHSRRIVVSWPGTLENDRLSYAAIEHPEHQDYGTADVVTFTIQ